MGYFCSANLYYGAPLRNFEPIEVVEPPPTIKYGTDEYDEWCEDKEDWELVEELNRSLASTGYEIQQQSAPGASSWYLYHRNSVVSSNIDLQQLAQNEHLFAEDAKKLTPFPWAQIALGWHLAASYH